MGACWAACMLLAAASLADNRLAMGLFCIS
jgi:hypothetical protein